MDLPDRLCYQDPHCFMFHCSWKCGKSIFCSDRLFVFLSIPNCCLDNEQLKLLKSIVKFGMELTKGILNMRLGLQR